LTILTGAPVWAMADPTTSTAAAAKTDLQADDQNKANLDQLDQAVSQSQATNQDQATEQHQTADQSESTDDDQQDDSFFGKPDSTKRLCWYIGGGITVAVSIGFLLYYLRNKAGTTLATPAIPPAQQQGPVRIGQAPPPQPTPPLAANETYTIEFEFGQNCPLNELQKQVLRQEVADLFISNYGLNNQIEATITNLMQRHQIRNRPADDFCQIGIRMMQENQALTVSKNFGGGAHHGPHENAPH
jgi:hypothetical protein